MSTSLRYGHITVNDLEEPLAFHRDVLALEARKDVRAGVSHWVTLGTATLRCAIPRAT